MTRIATVKFRCSDRLDEYDAGSLDLRWRDKVIGEIEKGQDLGIVMVEPREGRTPAGGMKKLVRKAAHEDLKRDDQNRTREKDTYRYCSRAIRERNLSMKLTDVVYCFDGSKIVFTFTAAERVDFRDLMKDLVQKYHTRVEMHQIGVRDEARRVGGIGACGRELCCTMFLREFGPVTVKMAKEQSLAFNPQKTAGFCGRLKCCLAYEYDDYRTLKPKKKGADA